MGATIINFQFGRWKAGILLCFAIALLVLSFANSSVVYGKPEKAPSSTSNEDRARRHVNRGRDLRNIGDLAGSMMDLNEAVRLDPYNVDAYVERGMTRGMKEDYDGSFFDFDRALEIDAKNTEALYHRAKVHIMQEDLEGAHRDLEEVLEQDPTHKAAYLRRGALKMDDEDYLGAIEDFSEVLKLQPNHYIALAHRGRAKARLKDYKGAKADFDRAIQLNNRLYQALYHRGNLHLTNGELSRALSDYDLAIEINRRFPSVLERRGLVYYSLGRYSEALVDLKKSASLAQTRERVDYPELWIYLTRINLGEDTEAHNQLANHVEERLRIEADGGEPVNGWYLEITRFLLGEIRASDFLEKATHEEEERTREIRCEAWYYLAQMRLREQDTTEAMSLLKKCVATELEMFYEYSSAQVQILKLSGRAGRVLRSNRRGG